jgi:GT2 family glycosyltransferase
MLSIVIVNWNTRDLLLACLKSIENNPAEEPMEVIVVDNHSSDGSADAVAQQHPNVRLIALDSNTGYAHANNVGIAAASGDAILTLNPDTEIQPGALQIALNTLRSDSKTGCVAARLVDASPPHATQHSVRGFPTLVGIFGMFSGIDRLFPRSKLASYRLPAFDYGRKQNTPQPMGTFLLFRADALAQVRLAQGPFDEQFPIFFNEVDLLFRLHQKGLSSIFEPDAVVFHHGGASTRQTKKAMIWESHASLMRYFRKHGTGFERLILPICAVFIYAIAFIRARGYSPGFRSEHHDLQLERS